MLSAFLMGILVGLFASFALPRVLRSGGGGGGSGGGVVLQMAAPAPAAPRPRGIGCSGLFIEALIILILLGVAALFLL
jgi:hypothetical protein